MMKCEKCGFIPNPGDTVCINCGAKISMMNAIVPEVETLQVEEVKKDNKKFIIGIVVGIVLLILIIFLIIKFAVLKD